jgi:hypothetical protein
MIEVKQNNTQEINLLTVYQALIPIEKLNRLLTQSKCVCAQSVNKIITMKNLNDTRFLLMKWKLNMRKTTTGQPNLGYPLFRRQD